MISVIVPVYNTEKFLSKCIDSILSQSYSDFELLLIDDGSTDRSLEICKEYADLDKRICVIQKENGGASSARNIGINLAVGKYILFIDSDDWIIPECLSMMVDCIIKYPQSQIVFAGAISTNGSWECLDYTNKDFPEFSDNQEWLCSSMLKRRIYGMMPWNKLVMRDFLINNSLYFVEGVVLEDEVWNFDISKNIRSASFINANTYYYNIHSDSVMRQGSEAVRKQRLLKIWNILIARIGGRNKPQQIRGIHKYIFEETPKRLSYKEKWFLCLIYLKLASKSFDSFSFRLILHGIRVLW